MALETRRGYKPDHGMVDGFGGFLLSAQALEPVMEAANDVADIAKDDTPRSNDGKGTPMADLYAAKPAGVIKVAGNPRQYAVVENTAPHSPAVEFGRPGKPGKRILRKAGAKVGESTGEPR